MNEVFERTIQLIGQDNFFKLEKKRVLIVGLGGVGGYAFETLIRAGINKFIICDNDEVMASNINRQIIATNDTIGQKKTFLVKKRGLEINPKAEIITIEKFIKEEDIESLFVEKVDYVVDCIDTMSTKVALWKYCQQNGIKVISSLGTAKRLDPSKLLITKLSKTSNDPMAKALRSIARKHDVSLEVDVVFSNEQPLLEGEQLGSMMFVPASSGIMCGYYVINDIIKDQNSIK